MHKLCDFTLGENEIYLAEALANTAFPYTLAEYLSGINFSEIGKARLVARDDYQDLVTIADLWRANGVNAELLPLGLTDAVLLTQGTIQLKQWVYKLIRKSDPQAWSQQEHYLSCIYAKADVTKLQAEAMINLAPAFTSLALIISQHAITAIASTRSLNPRKQ